MFNSVNRGLHTSEKFSSGTKNLKQTNKETIQLHHSLIHLGIDTIDLNIATNLINAVSDINLPLVINVVKVDLFSIQKVYMSF